MTYDTIRRRLSRKQLRYKSARLIEIFEQQSRVKQLMILYAPQLKLMMKLWTDDGNLKRLEWIDEPMEELG